MRLRFLGTVGLATVGAVLLAMLPFSAAPAAAQDYDYGSIAYSPSTGFVIAGFGTSISTAAQAAVQGCEAGGVTDCTTLDWFQDAVASFAIGTNGAYGTGNGWSNNITVATDYAHQYAIQTCQQYGGTNCRVTETYHTATVSSSGSGAPWTYEAGNYAGLSGTVSVVDYPEPEPSNDPTEYVNYCGPTASQVLISNWTENVPSIDTLGKEEDTNPNSGTLMSNMVTPINDAIGTDYYADLGGASNQEVFSNLIGKNILNGHPLITGVMTGVGTTSLNGWSNYNSTHGPVAHIITIYGFDFTSPANGKIYYMETAGTAAGTDKTGPQEIDYQSFWTLVYANNGTNVQLAGAG